MKRYDEFCATNEKLDLNTLFSKIRKGVLTGAMLLSIMNSDAYSSEEKDKIKEVVKRESTNLKMSSQSENILSIIRNVLELGTPLSEISDKDMKAVRLKVYKMSESDIADMFGELNLDKEDIKTFQQELTWSVGMTYNEGGLKEGVLDKATVEMSLKFLNNFKQRKPNTRKSIEQDKTAIWSFGTFKEHLDNKV
jgi:hypothetical protein